MKKYFEVSFKYSENIYCTNIAHAEAAETVNAHYSKYEWFSVRECEDYEVETARRRGMPVVEIETPEEEKTIKMKLYEVLEDNAGQLYLAVFDDKYNCIYIHWGYEYNPGQLQEDLQALKNGDDVLQWDGNCGGDTWEYGEDPQALYEEISPVCNVVADNDGIYPDKTGVAAKKEFGIK